MPASIIGSVFIIRGLYKNLFCNPEPDEKVFTPTSDCTSTSKEHKDTTSHDSGLHATAAGSAIIFTAANMWYGMTSVACIQAGFFSLHFDH